MSILSKSKTLFLIASNHSIITCNSKYLFILSHMRSRSSVLSHVLGSNNEILGHSELHLSYKNQIDIMKMKVKLYKDLKCDLRNKYLLDKILHNNLVLSEKVLKALSAKVIFLLRKPKSTLKSIINMGYSSGVDWHKSPERAAEYYSSRMSRLREYAKILGGEYFFLKSDDLVDKPDDVLRDLTGWLGLGTPLSISYSKFNTTGKPYLGDPSENILAGKIIKTKGHPYIDIPPDVLRGAETSYNNCKAYLTSLTS